MKADLRRWGEPDPGASRTKRLDRRSRESLAPHRRHNVRLREPVEHSPAGGFPPRGRPNRNRRRGRRRRAPPSRTSVWLAGRSVVTSAVRWRRLRGVRSTPSLRRQSGIGADIDTMGGSSTMPRWRSPRRQPRSDCNWAKAASISGGDNRPGVPGSQVSIAARSRRPGDHHGMSTRRAGSPGRTSHTRRWLGCPVSMGLRALRHQQPEALSTVPFGGR